MDTSACFRNAVGNAPPASIWYLMHTWNIERTMSKECSVANPPSHVELQLVVKAELNKVLGIYFLYWFKISCLQYTK